MASDLAPHDAAGASFVIPALLDLLVCRSCPREFVSVAPPASAPRHPWLACAVGGYGDLKDRKSQASEHHHSDRSCW
jgi:hypothetical protein